MNNQSTAKRALLTAAMAVGFVAAAAASATYTVKINAELNGLDVRIETVEQPAGLVVRLANHSPEKIRCDLKYDASPQPLYRKSTYVDPGKTEESVFKAKRRWFNVDVDVKCEAAKK